MATVSLPSRRSSPASFSSKESGTWPAPSEARAKALPLSLRAGGVPRSLTPKRAIPRAAAAEALERARVAHCIPLSEIAEAFGFKSDREAAEFMSGKILAGLGEVIANGPLSMALPAITERLRARLASESLATHERRLLGYYIETLERLAERFSAPR
jgi:hypothetical protein